MARTNKYTSINFNDIYDQKFNNNPSSNKSNINNSSSSSSSSSNNNNVIRSKPIISNSRIHGNMLVLTRPTPKPISIKEHQLKVPPFSNPPDQPAPELENISLRPQGRTGAAPCLVSPVAPVSTPSGSAFKTNKFVPPHLRPGFVGKEEKIVGPAGRGVVNRENGRPKSGGGGGGGYERMMRAGRGSDTDVHPSYFINRPASSGNRPNTSG